jgi:hypothetical protein
VATPPGLTLTPQAPPSGRSVLLSLAATAARQPAPTVRRYGYVSAQTWVWTRQRQTPRPAYPRYEVVTTWQDAQGTGRVRTLERTADGFHHDAPSSPPQIPARDPAASVAGLAAQLGPHSRLPVVLQFSQLGALASRRPIAPAQEAKLLARLARDPGVIDVGTTSDRTGRPGVAVSVSGDSQHTTLVFDQTSGRLLEADDTLLDATPKIDVPAGGLLSYRVILGSGWVSRVGQTPAS